jgi:hypothetical protein
MADSYEDHLMNIVVFVVVALSVMILQGCSPGAGPATATPSRTEIPSSGVPPTTDAADKARPALLSLKKFSLTKENLRLDYSVTNVSLQSIWVCVRTNQRENPDSQFSVETEIRDGTLHIRRRGNLRQEGTVTAGDVYAEYHRLPPGALHSDTVLLPLPVRSCSPVRVTGLPDKPIVLAQVVFELGYFRQDLRDLLPKEGRSQPYKLYQYGYFRDDDTAFVSYIIPRRWDKLGWERSVEQTIVDVNVPGKIP